jgi:hypothetical protein
MPTTLEGPTISEGDWDQLDVDCTDYLRTGETVSSATMAEVDTADLTIGTVYVNSMAIDILERTVAISKAVYASVKGQKIANSPYIVRVTITTSAGRKRVVDCRFAVE